MRRQFNFGILLYKIGCLLCPRYAFSALAEKYVQLPTHTTQITHAGYVRNFREMLGIDADRIRELEALDAER